MSDRSDRLLRLLANTIAIPGTANVVLREVPDSDVPDLIALSRAHGVEAWLAEHLPSKAGAWQPLREQRIRFAATLTRMRATLDRFAPIADRVGCNWLVLKGQAVAEDVYLHPRLKFSVDTDVLVDPMAFPDILDLLREDGWRLIDRNWPLLETSRPGQLRLISPAGSLMDLHWHLLNNPQWRREFPIKTADLLARRRVLASGMPALNEVDQLAHLGLHGALSGASRLSWLADAGLAARKFDGWSTLDDVAAAFGARAALVLVLQRARQWLATPVMPAPAHGGTADATWRTLCRTIDRLSPLGSEPDRPAVCRSFARSVRATPARSLAEFGRHGAAFARAGARGRVSQIGNPANPASPLHVVEDPAAREQYLASVVLS